MLRAAMAGIAAGCANQRRNQSAGVAAEIAGKADHYIIKRGAPVALRRACMGQGSRGHACICCMVNPVLLEQAGGMPLLHAVEHGNRHQACGENWFFFSLLPLLFWLFFFFWSCAF